MIESSAARERGRWTLKVSRLPNLPSPRRLRCAYLTVSPGISPSTIALEKERRAPPGARVYLCNRAAVGPPKMSTAPQRFNKFAYCRQADPARLPAGQGTDREQVPGADRETDPMPGRGTVRERRGRHGPRGPTQRSTKRGAPPPPNRRPGRGGEQTIRPASTP